MKRLEDNMQSISELSAQVRGVVDGKVARKKEEEQENKERGGKKKKKKKKEQKFLLKIFMPIHPHLLGKLVLLLHEGVEIVLPEQLRDILVRIEI